MDVSLDDYRAFLNGLLGAIDDAEMSGFDGNGIEQLREAYEFFSSDLRIMEEDAMGTTKRERDVRAKFADGQT